MVSRAERPPIYADEDIDRPTIENLRALGFDILTVQATGAFGEGDPEQLARAAAAGRVLLTYNRRHFRRHHAAWLAAGRAHAGIVSIPQGGTVERRVIGLALLLDWLGAESLASRCVSWGDLQARLHAGERVAGYSEAEIQLALALPET